MAKSEIELSSVEKEVLEKVERDVIYPPVEKTPCIQVDTFPLLGKLTALRFIEWVQNNPGGVISLPTGKTPEFFIKWTEYFLTFWNSKAEEELQKYSIDTDRKPDMKSLTFVQMDEFYPMEPEEQNSFYHYIDKYYMKRLGLNKERAMLMDTSEIGVPEGRDLKDIFRDGVDLSLRNRNPENNLEELQKEIIREVDQFCIEYEKKIREMGGIGFFLGGIGPDGHIAFNVRGSDFYSSTRLTSVNYETQAAAAVDLGGIEATRKRRVTTIGLSTITFNPEVTAIIMAAGTEKADVVAKAVQEEKKNLYPATVLQDLKGSRFYITDGAGSKLIERKYEEFAEKDDFTPEDIARVVVNLCLNKGKSINSLEENDYRSNRFSKTLIDKTEKSIDEINNTVESKILSSFEDGLKEPENLCFMHTAPHHDDIMLGYLPYILHLIRTSKNTHHYTYLTSGFTSVTNKYMLELSRELLEFMEEEDLEEKIEKDYFDPDNRKGRDRDVHIYLDGVAEQNERKRKKGESRRLLRNIIEVFEEKSLEQIKNRIRELISYFETQYPGKKDMGYIQRLKGMVREWEADVLWRYTGFSSKSVHHLRLGFYRGEIFMESPEFKRDIEPILQLMKDIKPDVITVALDPEASGPTTHYKVMQAISEALKIYIEQTGRNNIEIWGYRNVWEQFHPAEVNTLVPVSMNSIAILNYAFNNCFGSQKDASFPSYKHEGTFGELAQKIWVNQYQKIKNCLGDEYFSHNPHPRIRGTHGMVLLKKMDFEEFKSRTVELREYTEGSFPLFN